MTRRLAVLLLFCAAAPAQESYADALNAGIRLYEAGTGDPSKYEQAITRFAQARRLNPGDWRGHAWQAMTLLQLAVLEKESFDRRVALTREAESMTAMLVQQAKLPFQHPLRLYILGLGASLRGERERAVNYLGRGARNNPQLLEGFDLGGVELKELLNRAYARALHDLAKRYILKGKFEQSDPILVEAAKMMPAGDNVGRRDLERSRAVVDEGMGRLESAVKRLYKCIELYKRDRPDLQEEFLGTIALIYFKWEKYERGLEVLAEVPEGSTHPDILYARCTAHLHPALRAKPNDEKVAAAITYYQKAMEIYPQTDVHRLVEDYARLVLHKVGPREAKQEKPLLEDALRRLLREIERRPECPAFYFLAYRAYKLLGDARNEIKYQDLHTRKKKEFLGKAVFDHRGRPRCK